MTVRAAFVGLLLASLIACPGADQSENAQPTNRLPVYDSHRVSAGVVPAPGPRIAWQLLLTAREGRFCLQLKTMPGSTSGSGCGSKQPNEPLTPLDLVEAAVVAGTLTYQERTFAWGVASNRARKVRAEFKPIPLDMTTLEVPGLDVRFFVGNMARTGQRPELVAFDANGAEIGRSRPGATGSP